MVQSSLVATVELPQVQREAAPVREVVFISKATPGDDEFALWLAPRLEAEGYKVFADILNLKPGDQWRRILTSTLQDSAAKMLLCCRDETLARRVLSRKSRSHRMFPKS